MNNLDFFAEYEGQKRRAERIFESLDKKINSNKSELNEALFGLIKGAKEKGAEREVALKTYFNKLLKAPNWQNYKIDTGSGEVEIGNATPDQIEKAWEVFRVQGLNDSFTGTLKQDGDSIIYQKGGGKPMKDDGQQSADPNQAQNQDPNQDNKQKTPISYRVYKEKGFYVFGNNDRRAQSINVADSQLDLIEWDRSPIKWIFSDKVQFLGKTIDLDLKEGIVKGFDGMWIGPFKGGKLLGGPYKGNSFEGFFNAKNENFQAKPTAFIEGQFNDIDKKGILGIPNILKVTKKQFNLIQIPEGYSLNILTSSGVDYRIDVLKRLDIKDSNFVYLVTDGSEINPQSKQVVLAWPEIRTNYKNYFINSATKVIPKLLTLDSNESISELAIVRGNTPVVFKQEEKFDPSKSYEIDFAKFPTLGIGALNTPNASGSSVQIKIQNDSDVKQMQKMQNYLASNMFINDISNIAKGVRVKTIDKDLISKYPYVNYLIKSFLKEDASSMSPQMMQQLAYYINRGQKGGRGSSRESDQQSLQQMKQSEEEYLLEKLNSVIKFFEEKLVSSDPDSDRAIKTQVYSAINNLLKKYAGGDISSIMNQSTPTPTPTTASPTANPKAGSSTTKTKGVKPKNPKKGGAGGSITENMVRLEIRRILGDIL